MAISLAAVGVATAGAVLWWAAIQDPEGGPIQAVRDLLTGKLPTPGVQKTSQFDALMAQLSAGLETQKNAGGAASVGATGASSGLRGTVMSVAKSYIGSPYRWGGTSKSGIDCSGLVLQAYAAIGVKMSHDATSQTRKGKLVPQSQAQPGDLIAWGSPVRYPHIALYVGPGQQIDAPTYGQTVQVRKIYGSMDGGGPFFFNVIDFLPGAQKNAGEAQKNG